MLSCTNINTTTNLHTWQCRNHSIRRLWWKMKENRRPRYNLQMPARQKDLKTCFFWDRLGQRQAECRQKGRDAENERSELETDNKPQKTALSITENWYSRYVGTPATPPNAAIRNKKCLPVSTDTIPKPNARWNTQPETQSKRDTESSAQSQPTYRRLWVRRPTEKQKRVRWRLTFELNQPCHPSDDTTGARGLNQQMTTTTADQQWRGQTPMMTDNCQRNGRHPDYRR